MDKVLVKNRRFHFFSFTFIFLLLLVGLLGLSLISPRVASYRNQIIHRVITPPLSAIHGLGEGVARLFNRYIFLTQTAQENAQLKKQSGELKLQLNQLQSAELENQRLREILNYSKKIKYSFQVAQVLAIEPVAGSKTLLIDRGSQDEIRRGQAVITPDGVVGIVDQVEKNSAIVLLLIDPLASVAVEVESNHARGLLSGQQESLGLNRDFWMTRLEYLNTQTDLQGGERVVTSGLDQVFPQGLPVGRIETIGKDHKGLFIYATVLPEVDFSNLREVLVIRTEKMHP